MSVHDNVVTVHRVIQAIDCGVAVHPDNIKAQLEGGMVYGLTAVLRGEITLKNGAVTQTNFNDYPMLALLEMPKVESYIVPSTAAPGGVGEPGTGPIAPVSRQRHLCRHRHPGEIAAAVAKLAFLLGGP